jgi:hypothetical protein
METKNDLYSQWIDNLQKTKPRLADANQLTDRVMDSVQKSQNSAISLTVIFLRPILAATAVFLIGLLVFQHTDEAEISQTANIRYVIEKTKTKDFPCGNSEVLPTPNYKTLLKQYQCYREKKSADNQDIKAKIAKILNQNQ